jgi:hypothetical protein
MVRLQIETLEGRDLTSVGVLAGTAAGLTAPLGSTKGSVVRADDFTPPIGSNKGSPFAGDAYGNAMGPAAIVVNSVDDGRATDVLALEKNDVAVESLRDGSGIIAVPNGLRAPA